MARECLTWPSPPSREAGAEQLWANARDTALGFYLETGWEVIPGSEHISAETQLPHHVIVKLLHNQTIAGLGVNS